MAVKCILTGQTPSVLDGVTENVQTQLNDKVDKITGKGLSTNDYTSTEKTKLSGIEEGAQKNTITGVKGSAETTYRTGNVNITATNIGLGNVNNTSDAEKPISTATQTALDGKQATITGAATTITDNNLTANRALISNSSGKVAASSVTSTELGYLDGVTSNIQTQLNNKLSSAPVTSVNNKTGAVSLGAKDVGAQPTISANGILKGDGSGNITAANETEVELVSLPNICNPNLLDNWYFGNPVNQRGQTEWLSSASVNIPCVDRWNWWGQYAADSTLKLSNDGLQLIGTAGVAGLYQSIGQKIEKDRLPVGATVTLSALVKAEVDAGIILCIGGQNYGIVTVPANTWMLIDTVLKVPSVEQTHDITIQRNTAGATFTVKAVKLELGSQQTLAHQENGAWVLNEIPDYGEQLRRCQRYYQRLKASSGYMRFGISQPYTDTAAGVFIPLQVEMRTTPSMFSSGNFALFAGSALHGVNLSLDTASPYNVTLQATGTGLPGTSAQLLANADTSAYIEFSADL